MKLGSIAGRVIVLLLLKQAYDLVCDLIPCFLLCKCSYVRAKYMCKHVGNYSNEVTNIMKGLRKINYEAMCEKCLQTACGKKY